MSIVKKVKITDYRKQNVVAINYPPDPTNYVYWVDEEGAAAECMDKMLELLKRKDVKIEVVEEERYN
jgi:hypothetical protein